MKILVSVKRVVDFNVKVRVKPDGSDVDIANAKMSMNPFDEIAVEEAVQLKENGSASEVVAVTIGEKKCEEVLRSAIAMGADRVIHVMTDEEVQPLAVAKILKSIVESESPELVIMGKQAIDDDSNQTGQMLAEMLGWGQGTFASKVKLEDGFVNVTREVDGGLTTIRLNLPAVVTTDLRLNEPRYVKLPDIMKARSKPIESKTVEEIGVDISARLKLLKVAEPAQRQAGVKVESVAELMDKLRDEAKVI